MARSHHRKKHKEHLRQFRHKSDTVSSKSKSKAAGIFAIGGAIVGLAVAYFGSEASLRWVVAGVVIGGLAGFAIGRRVDRDNSI